MGREGFDGGQRYGRVRVAREFDEAFNEFLLGELAGCEGQTGPVEGEEGERDVFTGGEGGLNPRREGGVLGWRGQVCRVGLRSGR